MLSSILENVAMKNIIEYKNFKIQRIDRETKTGHKAFVLWFTGLSGSGKSTLASLTEKALFEDYNMLTYILDGDSLRSGLNQDLGFSVEDRAENIRRAAEVSKLLFECGVVVLSSFISPARKSRDNARKLFPKSRFIEVFVDCPLEVCERRDVKGLYTKARKGEIKDFTGIDSPFEAPKKPEIMVSTNTCNPKEGAKQIMQYLKEKNLL